MTTMLLFALLFSFLLCPLLDDDDDDDVDENDVVAICEFQNILHRKFCCSKTKSTNAFFLLSSMMMMVLLLLLSLLFSTSTTSLDAQKWIKWKNFSPLFAHHRSPGFVASLFSLRATRTQYIVKTNLGCVSRGV